MIVAAVIAVEVKDLLSSVVAVGAVGMGLSMAFLVLKAPDLAITQLVVEILCLIILIRATIRKYAGHTFFSGHLSFICLLLFKRFAAVWKCDHESGEDLCGRRTR
jgi:multisubunit Na+/H+ antiporter MnhB subunit